MFQFRRITTQRRFIPQIDGLRFVAIGSVVLFHWYAALERGAVAEPIALNTDLVKRGVELFFAISGFILGIPFASAYLLNAPSVNLKQYFLRRVTRLEPPCFISLFVYAAMQIIWSLTAYYMVDPWRHLNNWNKPANHGDAVLEELFRETTSKTPFAGQEAHLEGNNF